MRKIFLYNIFLFLFLIFFLEGLVRLFNLSNLLGINEELIITNSKPLAYKPNMQSVVFGIDVYTDTYGFRVPSKKFNYSKKNSILILGDSTSYGVGVKEQQTFVGLLRERFPEINFYNSSLAGHNIHDHILLLEKLKNKIDFNEILYFLNLNDIDALSSKEKIQNLSNDNNENLSISEKLKKNSIFSNLNFYLRSRSALYVYIKSLVSDPSKTHFEKTYKNYLIENNLTLFEKNLDKIFLDLNNKYSISVIILPWEFQMRENCTNKNLFLPQKVLKKYFLKNKIDYVDFSKNFCEEENVKKLFLNFDPAHLSESGHIFTEKLLLKYNKVQ